MSIPTNFFFIFQKKVHSSNNFLEYTVSSTNSVKDWIKLIENEMMTLISSVFFKTKGSQ